MDLKDCQGIIYGPMTTTFQRATLTEDPPWSCFSLLFADRTLDLAVPGDAIESWFLGLQLMLIEKRTNCSIVLSEAEFLYRKVFLKLEDSAHKQGLTTHTMLLGRLGVLSRELGFGSKASIVTRTISMPAGIVTTDSAADQEA